MLNTVQLFRQCLGSDVLLAQSDGSSGCYEDSVGPLADREPERAVPEPVRIFPRRARRISVAGGRRDAAFKDRPHQPVATPQIESTRTGTIAIQSQLRP